MLSTEPQVKREAISFESNGTRLTGNLHLPHDSEPAGGLPAVVVVGTWTSIKEQMADRYAESVAAEGIAALSFDFTGFGTSGGYPRDVESAGLKCEDIRQALTFLGAHPLVNAERLGALAICAGTMYAAMVARADPRLRALALVAPWMHDPDLVRAAYGGESGVRRRLALADDAAAHYARTGVIRYVPVADASDPDAAIPMEADFYTNPRRGGIAGWPNRFALMSWHEWLTLDAIALAPEITATTLIVHSEDAAIPDGARRFHQGLAGPKEIVWIPGTQFDFYDQPETVNLALAHVTRHLRTNLMATNTATSRG